MRFPAFLLWDGRWWHIQLLIERICMVVTPSMIVVTTLVILCSYLPSWIVAASCPISSYRVRTSSSLFLLLVHFCPSHPLRVHRLDAPIHFYASRHSSSRSGLRTVQIHELHNHVSGRVYSVPPNFRSWKAFSTHRPVRSEPGECFLQKDCCFVWHIDHPWAIALFPNFFLLLFTLPPVFAVYKLRRLSSKESTFWFHCMPIYTSSFFGPPSAHENQWRNAVQGD